METEVDQELPTVMWNALAERLDLFVAAWDAAPEPPFAEFLPEAPPNLRRMVLVELIKIDLERRAERNRLFSLDEYGRQFPELHEDGEPPLDVIYEDFHIRRTRGDDVAATEYYTRYPRQAEALKRLLGAGEMTVSTGLFRGKQVHELSAGQKVDDFELLVELGTGAFGSVFLARQVSMQRLVALKVSADKGSEPQTLAQLDHANIIRVYDQRCLPERKLRLMYMQFAPGGTLADVVERNRKTPLDLRSGGVLVEAVTAAVNKTGTVMIEETSARRKLAAAPWPETVCRIGIQLAQALDYAHRQGVLHRDVKPANILLSTEGSPKLADFNISFSSQLDGASPAAYFGGSLAYMSPEQLEACNPHHPRKPDELDGRSDLYSLAVVLWELLHGERPFNDREVAAGWSATLVAMADRRRNERPQPPPGAARDALTKRLESILLRTMAPERKERPFDGAALARELSLALHPRAWDLLYGLSAGRRSFMRRKPITTLTLITLPPFIVAGIFNWFYNGLQLIWPHPERVASFNRIVWLVNPPAYTLGTILVIWYAWPFARTLHRVVAGRPTTEAERSQARLRGLRVCYCIAFLALFEWLVAAGLAFPIGLQLALGSVPVEVWIHFLMSSLCCGLVSAGLPFLTVMWAAVQVFFPALLLDDEPAAAEQRQLAAGMQHAGVVLATTAITPILALSLLILAGREQGAAAERGPLQITILLFLLACITLFLIAYALYGRIRRDVSALKTAMNPGDPLAASETISTEF